MLNINLPEIDTVITSTPTGLYKDVTTVPGQTAIFGINQILSADQIAMFTAAGFVLQGSQVLSYPLAETLPLLQPQVVTLYVFTNPEGIKMCDLHDVNAHRVAHMNGVVVHQLYLNQMLPASQLTPTQEGPSQES